MALQIARPFEHPKTGVCDFRQRVHKDFRPLLGNKVTSRTLRTKAPERAKVLNASEVLKQAMAWERRRKLPEPLPHPQIVALSGLLYQNRQDRTYHAWSGIRHAALESGQLNKTTPGPASARGTPSPANPGYASDTPGGGKRPILCLDLPFP
jgi:hypothetical protein